MKINYYSTSVIFSLISIGQLIHILMWIIGLGGGGELPLEFIMMMATVILTVTLLILFSYTNNKSDSLKIGTGLFSMLFVLATLIWVVYSFLMFELSSFGIALLILIVYIITGILLLLKIGREIIAVTR